jgi:hypothetical protein
MSGTIMWNATRIPSGMLALANYDHSLVIEQCTIDGIDYSKISRGPRERIRGNDMGRNYNYETILTRAMITRSSWFNVKRAVHMKGMRCGKK